MERLYILALLITVLNYSESLYNEDPYLSIEEEEYAVPVPCKEYCSPNVRETRQAHSHITSRIIDVMKLTPTLHINPAEPDIFSLLRDKYELPKGKF